MKVIIALLIAAYVGCCIMIISNFAGLIEPTIEAIRAWRKRRIFRQTQERLRREAPNCRIYPINKKR